MVEYVSREGGGRLHTVLRYLLLGGLAAAVNWGSRFGWSLVFPFYVAVLLAYGTGMVVAFTLFRRFVFPGSPRPLHLQVRDFVLVNILGVAQTWAVSMVLVDRVFPMIGFTFQPDAIGHGLGIAAPVVTSWFAHSRLTFARG